jgi:hypothetical protein
MTEDFKSASTPTDNEAIKQYLKQQEPGCPFSEPFVKGIVAEHIRMCTLLECSCTHRCWSSLYEKCETYREANKK